MKFIRVLFCLVVALCIGFAVSAAFELVLPGSSPGLTLAAIPVISASAAAEKWARRAAGATQDYTNGVANPSVDWATATRASEENYKTAVIAAANAGRFGKGVQSAGSEKQKRMSVEKGGARWAPGISASQDAFGSGIARVLSTVSSLTLPPRGVKGDPRNLQRVTVVANALHAMKGK